MKMSRLSVIIIYLALFLNGTISAQKISPQDAVSGQWIKSWLLCGPIPLREPSDALDSYGHLAGFNTDYLKKAGGEQNLKVKSGDVVKYANGSAIWKIYNSPDSIIDLDKSVSTNNYVIAYAWTEIQSDEDKTWILSLGSNDGGKLWVNGLNVWDHPESRGLSADDDLIPVVLRKGNNSLLLKIEEKGNRWGFCVRLLPFSTEKITEQGELLRITTGENGEASMSSEYSVNVLQQLIQYLNIEIVNSQNKPVYKEHLTTDFCRKLNLDSNK